MAKVLYRLIWPAAIVECVAVVATGAYLGLREKPAAASVSVCETPCCGQAITAGSGEVDDPIVCTMRGDRYYHRRSCCYVRPSRIAMPLSRARRHCRPCSRCKPRGR